MHVQPVVQTHTGLGTRATREYPYPYPSKPVPVLTGTGFRRVWVRVLVELPMGYP